MFVVILSGQIADYMRSTWFSTTLVRKTFTVVGVYKFVRLWIPFIGHVYKPHCEVGKWQITSTIFTNGNF